MYKKNAAEFLEITRDVFDRQGTAKPCIYFYDGGFGFSRGDTLGGVAEPVYNGKADIIVETEQLKELLNEWEYNYDNAVQYLAEKMQDFVDSFEE